jgi:hypothetical protein
LNHERANAPIFQNDEIVVAISEEKFVGGQAPKSDITILRVTKAQYFKL